MTESLIERETRKKLSRKNNEIGASRKSRSCYGQNSKDWKEIAKHLRVLEREKQEI